jgi:hypothetical protein
VWSLGHGLPGVYNPDEIPILNRALAFARGDVNPHNFLYPSLHFYILFVWEVLFFVVGRLTGLFQSLAAFQQEYFRDPSRLILAGRALTAVFGTLTLIAVYRLGQRLYGRTAGVAAAAFLAAAPFAVRDAHYVKLDVPVAMFTTLAHVALARIVVDPVTAARRRSWLWAGFLAGLAISTQYYVLFIVVAIAAVAVGDTRQSGRWQTSLGLLAVAAAGTIAGFLTGTPFIAVEPSTAMRDIAGVREVDIDRALASGGGAFVSLLPYARMLTTDALGWPVAIAALAGTVMALLTDWRRGVLLVAFPCSFLAFIAHTVPQSRYLDAVLPLAAVAAGYAISELLVRFQMRSALVTSGVVGVVALPGLLGSVKSDIFFGQDDTRTLARVFIERDIPAGATMLVQPYGPPIQQSREALVEALRTNLGSESNASIKFQLMLSISPYPAPAYRKIYLGDGGTDPDKIYVSLRSFEPGAGLEPLRRFKIEYVVLERDLGNQKLAPLQGALEREAHLMASFSPYRRDVNDRQPAAPPYLHNTATRIDSTLDRPGPIVDVWRLP